jgi:hypothetical protein
MVLAGLVPATPLNKARPRHTCPFVRRALVIGVAGTSPANDDQKMSLDWSNRALKRRGRRTRAFNADRCLRRAVHRRGGFSAIAALPALVTFQLINDGSAGFSGSMSFLR